MGKVLHKFFYPEFFSKIIPDLKNVLKKLLKIVRLKPVDLSIIG